ncbi:MAG TPA: lipopolysaccharide biosynthesis protein [Gemmataceae bacterium]|nr:lipopolysaccharide biosynthesis protein [Gemmataceae bacterium]
MSSASAAVPRAPRTFASVLASAAFGKATLSIFDQGLVSGTSFVTSVLLGRLCSPEDLGTYALALSIVMVVRGIQGELVNTPYTIYCHRRSGVGRAAYTGSALVHHLLLSAVGVGALLGLAAVLSSGVGPASLAPVAWVLAGAVPLLMLREYLRQLSLAHLRLGAVIAVDAAVAALQLGGLLLLARLGALGVGAAYAVMALACAAACLGWFLLAKQPIRVVPGQVAADWRHNWAFSRWTLASFLIASTTPYLMPWVVAVSHGAEATGVLAACQTLVNLAGTYVTGVSNFLTPRAASAYARGGLGELRRVLWGTAALYGVSLGLFCVAAALGGDLPAVLVYGGRYTGVGPILTVLSLATLVNSMGITAGNGLWALERPRANFAADVCSMVATVGGSLALVPPLGALGAALAVLAGVCAGTAVRCVTLARLVAELGRDSAAEGGPA